MHMVITELQAAGFQPHNIDGLEKDWKIANDSHYDTHATSNSKASKHSQLKTHCFVATSMMYNHGDKRGTKQSANILSDQVAARMEAFKQLSAELEETQYKMAEAILDVIAHGDTTISGDGGIPPVIETKSMGTAPTE